MHSLSLLDLLPFILVGFAAQLVDGALGMAFGVISSAFLMSLGVPPASASASVHVVETLTTAASGTSHLIHKNIDWRLFARLVIPGVAGAMAGAYAISSVDASIARPIVTIYLLGVGIFLLWRGLAHEHREKEPKAVEPLGAVGGFLDAAGGGGWGPIVTSNLLIQGTQPRKAIGTVNSAEFFITMTISGTFIATLGFAAFTSSALGLLIGGLVAAPLGAWAAKHVKASALLVLVGGLLTVTSAYGLSAQPAPSALASILKR